MKTELMQSSLWETKGAENEKAGPFLLPYRNADAGQ